MRIIAGEFKGRNLSSVPEQGVRPVTDMVKSTIFNMLQNRLNLINADVLDVFAGSGSLGFEALSRGAKQAVFIEFSPIVIKTITTNAELLRCEDRCEILKSDAFQYLQFCRSKFDLIFIDPPYAYERITELPGIVFQKDLLNHGGFLIIEHSKHTMITSTVHYRLAVQKEFGQTRVSFITHQEPEP
jgi:16S rRNA (guanine(966)-N(2))-methyltransferase RsmD